MSCNEPPVRIDRVVAQAAATLGVMSDGRFSLGLGVGERLNEHVVAAGWPGVVERHERLGEALDIIQGLLAGKITSYRGRHLQLDHAKLFDRPTRKPAVIVAAGGPERTPRGREGRQLSLLTGHGKGGRRTSDHN